MDWYLKQTKTFIDYNMKEENANQKYTTIFANFYYGCHKPM